MLVVAVHQTHREFMPKLLLAHRAAARWGGAIIARRSWISNNAHFIAPSFILDMATTRKDSSMERFFNFKNNGHRVGAFSEEASVIFDKIAYVRKDFNPDLVSRLDRYFLFGDWHKDVILNEYTGRSDNFVVSGHPRFDILSKKYRAIFTGTIRRIKKNYKKHFLVLINNNAGEYCFNKEAYKTFLKNNINFYDSEKEIEYEIEMHNMILNNQVKVAELLIKSKYYKDIDVVFRPHPTCSAKTLKAVIGQYSNSINIDNRFSIFPWLHCADALMHYKCTTAIEGLVAGVTPFSVVKKPLGIDDYSHPATQVSFVAESNSECADMIIDYLNNRNNYIKTKEQKYAILNKWYKNLENGSLEIILNSIESYEEIHTNQVKKECLELTTMKSEIKKMITEYKGLVRQDDFEKPSSFLPFSINEAKDTVKCLNHIHSNEINIKSITPEAYYLYT